MTTIIDFTILILQETSMQYVSRETHYFNQYSLER